MIRIDYKDIAAAIWEAEWKRESEKQYTGSITVDGVACSFVLVYYADYDKCRVNVQYIRLSDFDHDVEISQSIGHNATLIKDTSMSPNTVYIEGIKDIVHRRIKAQIKETAKSGQVSNVLTEKYPWPLFVTAAVNDVRAVIARADGTDKINIVALYNTKTSSPVPLVNDILEQTADDHYGQLSIFGLVPSSSLSPMIPKCLSDAVASQMKRTLGPEWRIISNSRRSNRSKSKITGGKKEQPHRVVTAMLELGAPGPYYQISLNISGDADGRSIHAHGQILYRLLVNGKAVGKTVTIIDWVRVSTWTSSKPDAQELGDACSQLEHYAYKLVKEAIKYVE